MNELDALPPIQKTWVEPELLAQLLFDIEHAAELESVVWKAGPSGYAGEVVPVNEPARALRQVHEAMTEGTSQGVQLRYRFRGETYTDTLMRRPEGLLLIRAQVPVLPA